MHGSFVTGADCFANTVGGQDTTASAGTCGKKSLLVIKWTEVFQLIGLHVLCHCDGHVLECRLGTCVKQGYAVWLETLLITAPAYGTTHQHTGIYHALLIK